MIRKLLHIRVTQWVSMCSYGSDCHTFFLMARMHEGGRVQFRTVKMSRRFAATDNCPAITDLRINDQFSILLCESLRG
jgi:hypothetical protein